MKKGVVFAVLAFAISLPLAAQQVTKVAVCNWTQILSASYKETQAVRELEDFKAAYQKEILAISADISDTENKKLEADKAGNKALSLQLEKDVSDKRSYLDDYRRIKTESYKQKAAKIFSAAIVKEIQDAVDFVAEQDGYALVLRSDGNYADMIIENIPEIDITQKVIDRIKSLSKPASNG